MQNNLTNWTTRTIVITFKPIVKDCKRTYDVTKSISVPEFFRNLLCTMSSKISNKLHFPNCNSSNEQAHSLLPFFEFPMREEISEKGTQRNWEIKALEERLWETVLCSILYFLTNHRGILPCGSCWFPSGIQLRSTAGSQFRSRLWPGDRLLHLPHPTLCLIFLTWNSLGCHLPCWGGC